MKRFFALALLLAACSDPHGSTPSSEVVSMPATGGNALDILLVIDDSASVAHLQSALAEHFDTLLRALETTVGGPLDLHIGVTTSDYGTTALQDPSHPGPPLGQLGNGGCAGAGKDGALIVSGAPVTSSYLIDGPTNNYTGTRRDALGVMFKVGSGGCGFEQPLAASLRAFVNPANAGFRRDMANLLVIFLQDEDDCSLLDPALMGPESAELGPVQSFRCTRFGVQCDEDTGVLGVKHNCRARADSPFVTDVGLVPDQLRSRVVDPARLVVGVIAGATEPFEIEQRTPPGGGAPILALGNSCVWTAPEGNVAVANPPVRMQSLLEDMGAHGSLTTVCTPDLDPSLIELARVAKQMFGVACLDPSKLRDTNNIELGVQPACTGTLVSDGVETPLPACPAEGPCFEVVADPVACAEPGDHLRFVVHHAPTDAYIRASCQLPVAGDDPN